ncbi:proline-rich transmembrane protein 1-like [Rana temporaria]|uniref:proline-rich transmembrane protein 1-like n=1 Tax=Rana temporaria TaxID=8407 RepID=UPI001AADA25F|nr:proline-rich transmembrane protein 1-like [Rana temporaria]
MYEEDNSYETLDLGHWDNPTPCYDNPTPCYDLALPEMDTTERTFYPPALEYVEVLPDLQPGGMVNPTPYHINNPSEGTFSMPTVTPSPGRRHPQDVRLPFRQHNNSHQIIQKPPPMYNPGYLPPQQYPQNFPVPGTMMGNTVQPTVVTTQTTVSSTPTPPCRDYLPWSIFNLLCCCCCFGIVALFFSLQTQSAKKNRDLESAQRKSRVALGFNLAAMLLGISLIIIVPSVYYSLYRSSYYYPSYYYG